MNTDEAGQFFYSDGKENLGRLSREEIQKRIANDPRGRHLIWREGWPEWKQALEIFPAPDVFVSRQAADGTGMPEPQAEGTVPPGQEAAAAQVLSPRPAAAADGTPEIVSEPVSADAVATEHRASPPPSPDAAKRPGNSFRWYVIATVVLAAAVVVFLFVRPGGEDLFPGIYAFTGENSEAVIRIAAEGDNGYRITGESFANTRNEYGPDMGEIDFIGVPEDDVLVAHGEDGYVLKLRIIGDDLEASEEGSNPDFGMNVSFAHRYTRTTDEALAELRRTAQEAAVESNRDEEEYPESDPGLEPQVSLDIGGAEVLGLAGTWWVTSTLENDDENYGVANLDDNDATTVWAEGEPGAGVGARLEFTPQDSEVGTIAGFRILNGHCRTRKLWEANARVRGLRVTSGSKQYTVELYDTPDWQYVYLPECTVDGPMVFEVLSVYPGSKYEDLTISELGIVWELQSDE